MADLSGAITTGVSLGGTLSIKDSLPAMLSLLTQEQEQELAEQMELRGQELGL